MGRAVDPSCVFDHSQDISVSSQDIANSINDCYSTLDAIDAHLGSMSLSETIELTNLSSMIGNILASNISGCSTYTKNKSHRFPDLLSDDNSNDLEIKVSLECNKPKGHHPKPGNYLLFRYVLADKGGEYRRGQRGNTPWIYEVRLGRLGKEDFNLSNTSGDSGKTATIKAESLKSMTRIIHIPWLSPYVKEYCDKP